MKQTRLKKGDIVEVPLPNGKTGFIQYFFHDKWGDLIGIYDYTINWNDKLSVDGLKNKKFKFYPILTRIIHGTIFSDTFQHLEKLQRLGLASEIFIKMASDSLHDYNWKIIGNLKVDNFIYPNFIWKDGATLKKNEVTKWYLYNGKENIELGKRLPDQYKKLEYQSSVPPETVVELIMNNTAKSRVIERDMIKKG